MSPDLWKQRQRKLFVIVQNRSAWQMKVLNYPNWCTSCLRVLLDDLAFFKLFDFEFASQIVRNFFFFELKLKFESAMYDFVCSTNVISIAFSLFTMNSQTCLLDCNCQMCTNSNSFFFLVSTLCFDAFSHIELFLWIFNGKYFTIFNQIKLSHQKNCILQQFLFSKRCFFFHFPFELIVWTVTYRCIDKMNTTVWMRATSGIALDEFRGAKPSIRSFGFSYSSRQQRKQSEHI